MIQLDPELGLDVEVWMKYDYHHQLESNNPHWDYKVFVTHEKYNKVNFEPNIFGRQLATLLLKSKTKQ